MWVALRPTARRTRVVVAVVASPTQVGAMDSDSAADGGDRAVDDVRSTVGSCDDDV